jgi:hypothetical protein
MHRKIWMIVPLALIAASCALLAQSNGPYKTPVIGRNIRQIVLRSLAATERSLQAREHFTFMERDQDRRLDSSGKLKSENVEVTRMIVVNGTHFEQLVERNGKLPSAEEQKKNDKDLEKLLHETREEQAARLLKARENMSFLWDLFEAFDFQLIGEEIVSGRPAFVLQAKPHLGYQPHGKYGKLLSKVEGKLWIDKLDFGCIKADVEVTQAFSVGFLIARVQRGSHFVVEQTPVDDGVWVPRRLEMRASATALYLKHVDLERIITYSDYRPAADGTYTVSR